MVMIANEIDSNGEMTIMGLMNESCRQECCVR